MARKKSDDDDGEEKPDPFITLVQTEIETALKAAGEVREKSAILAIAVRFLAVRNKIEGGDDGDDWYTRN